MSSEDAVDLANMIPIIHDIRAMCNPVEDINLMKRVAVLMEESVRSRQEEVEQMRSELKPLTSKLVSARQSSQRPPNVPSPAAHAQTISKLDAKRFKLVKSIEEGEGALNEKEAEYSRLKAELKELEEKDVTNDVELDGTAVRLNLYRELGFQWVEDKTSGETPKIIIRSESDDVHLVRLDDSIRDFELKNRLWELNSK